MSQKGKFRLVTRNDFDGLVCAALLKHLDLIEEIKFVHPKDMQDSVVDVTFSDITTNLPYAKRVHLAFDHHVAEAIRVGKRENHIVDPQAQSAARVVFNHYGGASAFPASFEPMVAAVDQGDSGRFSRDDILHPTGWTLLSFILDPRTGLGRIKSFTLSDYKLKMELIAYCQAHSIQDILDLPDVKERVNFYFEQEEKFKDQIRRCSKVHNNLIVLDLRREESIYVGNRFMIYAMYPDCNISIQVLWGLDMKDTVFAVGKSILNTTSATHIGPLMAEYGGGGHENAGTCQVDSTKADSTLAALIKRINADG